MTDFADWQKANEEYLSAALAWLRLRLERLSGKNSGSGTYSEEGHAPRRNFLRWRSGAVEQTVHLLPPANITEDVIFEAASAMERAAKRQPPPALIMLAERFGLSSFERDLLLLCAAIELDTRIASLCSLAQGEASRSHPTFALAMSLFEEPAWEVLSPERPLRYWRLIEINQPGATALTISALRADERVVNYIKGLNYLDDRLAPLLIPAGMERHHKEIPASQTEIVESITRQIGRATAVPRCPSVQLLGADSASKKTVAFHATAALGLQLYHLPCDMLPSQPGELETLARLWQRESVLLPVALFVDAHELDSSHNAGQAASVSRFLNRSNGVFFLDTREMWQGLESSVAFDITKPTSGEQMAAWQAAFGDGTEETASRLSTQFNLSTDSISRIIAAASDDSEGADGLEQRVWAACNLLTRPRLDVLAQRLDPRAMWDDIVLPAHEMALLRQIASQVRQRRRVYEDWGFAKRMNRGLGINALCAGESGTGKTMAAEVLANDLKLNLYRIDLSAVVSKYIGETEKNLRRLFDAAEDGGAILFFDEADALFGKRSEVKDSHDRYANIEINYLLQRIETYRGLAILATNMKSALDTAFMRRLRFIVNFPFPGATERRQIWQRVFPPETETDGLDYDRLAMLNLTGGSIHNTAINAAFMAADEGLPVMMGHILESARIEFKKLERPVNDADFRWKARARAGL
jgi:ATPase family associated with various cellular activities (AAA)/Winged helix domain, variant